jgi:hypothetical protein
MKLALKTLAAGVLLATGASNALAASNDSVVVNNVNQFGGGSGTGDLVFAYEALDINGAAQSILWDLSNGADDLTFTSILSSGAFTINNPDVTAFVAANPGGRWNLFGLTNTKKSGSNNNANMTWNKGGYALTVNTGTDMTVNAADITAVTGGAVEGFMVNNAQWIAAANNAGFTDNGTLTAGPADAWQFNAGATHSAFIANQNATGLVGDTLGFWTILIDDTVTRGFSPSASNAKGRSAIASMVMLEGKPAGFTFAANGDLSYAPVPVPAAVWLMGSAIAGLGVMRRRKA